MGYRELSRMEIVEVVRHWQAGISQRGIARATGLARETVRKYLAAAGTVRLGSEAAEHGAHRPEPARRSGRDGLRPAGRAPEPTHWQTPGGLGAGGGAAVQPPHVRVADHPSDAGSDDRRPGSGVAFLWRRASTSGPRQLSRGDRWIRRV